MRSNTVRDLSEPDLTEAIREAALARRAPQHPFHHRHALVLARLAARGEMSAAEYERSFGERLPRRVMRRLLQEAIVVKRGHGWRLNDALPVYDELRRYLLMLAQRWGIAFQPVQQPLPLAFGVDLPLRVFGSELRTAALVVVAAAGTAFPQHLAEGLLLRDESVLDDLVRMRDLGLLCKGRKRDPYSIDPSCFAYDELVKLCNALATKCPTLQAAADEVATRAKRQPPRGYVEQSDPDPNAAYRVSIGHVAEQLDAPYSLIRSLVRHGFASPNREVTGSFRYSDEDVRRLRTAVFLARCGLAKNDIGWIGAIVEAARMHPSTVDESQRADASRALLALNTWSRRVRVLERYLKKAAATHQGTRGPDRDSQRLDADLVHP